MKDNKNDALVFAYLKKKKENYVQRRVQLQQSK